MFSPGQRWWVAGWGRYPSIPGGEVDRIWKDKKDILRTFMMIIIAIPCPLHYLSVDIKCCMAIFGYASKHNHFHFLADSPLHLFNILQFLFFIIIVCDILFYRCHTNFELNLAFPLPCNIFKSKTDTKINFFEY